MKSYLAGQASLFPFWCTHFTQSFHINPPGKLRTVLLFTIAAWTSVQRSTYYKDAQYMSQTWQTTCAWEMKRGWLTDINRPALPLLPVKIERERKKKKNTSCLLSDYPTSTWSINSSHFVLLQTKHVFQICPCNSPWDLAVCVCGAMSLQESSSIVNSYSRESLQTKLSDP